MLQDILVVDIVELDDAMFVRGKEIRIERTRECREHMADVGRLESRMAP